ncbi:MOSC domain-containing protein [Gammaproteobacteria bacterium]|nr:MOSC domain-containing protein [Gammaproteobacteria bacterium]
MSIQVGQIIGIAKRQAKRAKMEVLSQAHVNCEYGLEDDFRGKPGPRQFSILTEEGWRLACEELSQDIHWTVRRANLFIKGLDLKQSVGNRLIIGDLILEITDELDPCIRMEEQVIGLRKALIKDWRGGVLCRVINEGMIKIDDRITLE